MKGVIFLVCCFAVVHSWTFFEQVSIDPNNPGVCVSIDSKVGTMKVGETKAISGLCVRASCGSGLISYAGCGTVGAPEGCKVTPENVSKPYPECCPSIVCP